MATLVLSVAGRAVGGALLGGVGAIVGGVAGAVAGSIIDGAMAGGRPSGASAPREREGPRLSDLNVQASTEGAPIPKVYGRVRLSGQIIWATPFQEVVTVEQEEVGGGTVVTGGGGKGGGGRSGGNAVSVPGQIQTITTYSYFGNFAVGLCEGPISAVTRVWADGKPLDLRQITMRTHRGTEEQGPDSLIGAVMGAGGAPAYRGLAYVVFERLPLADFGNRIPQLSFEVMRVVPGLETAVRAVTVIPAASEFGYDPLAVRADLGPGRSRSENVNTFSGSSDWTTSMDELSAACPNLERAALVISWFGSDLRAGACRVRPGVEVSEKETVGATWSVAGLQREAAYLVSRDGEGRPAYGGTPSDISVIRAIRDLRARGLKVVFYPFLMMDVPPGNGLANPYSDEPGQPPHPWRGEITLMPAPGREGSPDGTAAAEAQVSAFFGTAQRGHFAVSGDAVHYWGPDEWSWRRMILHYAHLCAAAGGVDAFLVGTEMRGLTSARSGAGAYPAVAAFAALAADAKAVLGAATKVSYAADWSEYFGHQPDDGSGDVFFHLDPLWSSPTVDMVAIDNYMPLADWRDGEEHLDRALGADIYDADYLRGRIAGGEGFDFYYASGADRAAQIRTPISDGSHGEDWLFRYKDLVAWWSNTHHDRPGGARAANPTGWVPRSKPIWFTEIGCPAVDKGANQPNVFFDPKSSSSALPHFSSGQRDDLMQRRFLEAVTSYFDPASPHFSAAGNPVSPVYGGRMVPADAIHLWTWDARPYPAFPFATDVWSDGPNWDRGHWLTGRLSQLSVDRLIGAILDDYGIGDYEIRPISGLAEGYIVDRPMSARQAIGPLLHAFFGEALESDGRVVFRARPGPVVADIAADDLAIEEGRPDVATRRAQETELPRQVSIAYTDGARAHRRAVVGAIEPATRSARELRAELALVSTQTRMQGAARTWLKDIWAGRESFDFALPPSALALEPGDIVALDWDGRRHVLQIETVRDRGVREVTARRFDPGLFVPASAPEREGDVELPAVAGPPHILALDLPQFREGDPAHVPHIAAFADPWPGALAVWREAAGGGLAFEGLIDRPAATGRTLDAWPRGPVGIWDRASRLTVRMDRRALASADERAVLDGANAAAIHVGGGAFEIVQFAEAELIGEETYRLSHFLRGQLGSEAAMAELVPAGADFVMLDGALSSLPVGLSALGETRVLRVGAAGEPAGGDAFTGVDVAVSGRGLKPWAPAHLRARVEGEALVVTWIRRSRALAADNWALPEVPEPEEIRAWEIDLIGPAGMLAGFSTSETRAEIALAPIRAARGPEPAPVTIRIHQMSALVGRGFAGEVTILV